MCVRLLLLQAQHQPSSGSRTFKRSCKHEPSRKATRPRHCAASRPQDTQTYAYQSRKVNASLVVTFEVFACKHPETSRCQNQKMREILPFTGAINTCLIYHSSTIISKLKKQFPPLILNIRGNNLHYEKRSMRLSRYNLAKSKAELFIPARF